MGTTLRLALRRGAAKHRKVVVVPHDVMERRMMNLIVHHPTHALGLNPPFDRLRSVPARGIVGDAKKLQGPEGRTGVRRLSGEAFSPAGVDADDNRAAGRRRLSVGAWSGSTVQRPVGDEPVLLKVWAVVAVPLTAVTTYYFKGSKRGGEDDD